jgi:DNA topoisomerase II
MAFSKKRVEDRKHWLLALEPGVHIDYDVDDISYDEFVNKELILFSHADNQRSIPHLIDGFKPSQRKVLYSCFKRNLKQEIKVAQLAGYVSEHSAYHHGEASLTQTIIGMAQNFVGCGNINLLTPCGQFGTRLMGGKDAASPRYVFTKLEPITRCIFHPDDDALLEYLDEDGQTIEPTFYVPVIPMVLVNGSEGIGTGWSTSIPTYNPRDVIHNLRALIQEDGSEVPLHPWYRGFTGEVRAKTGRDSHNYVVSGTITQTNDSTVVISELPVGKTTTDYKQFLEGLLIGASDSGFIKEFRENHTDTTVLFTLTLAPEKLAEICAESGGLVKKFKIDGSTATTNMHAFDTDSKITKYDHALDIMKAFSEVRMEFYEKRKIHLANKLSEEWEKLDNRVRFILAVVHGELIVSNRKKKDILAELKSEGYKTFFPTKKNSTVVNGDEEDADEDQSTSISTPDNLDKGYDYLLSMKIWNLTEEKVNELCKEREAKREALDTLMRKTPGDLWLEDLDALEVALDAFEAEIENQKSNESAARKKAGKGRKGKPTKKRAASVDSDSEMDSDFEDEKPKSKARAPKKVSKAAVSKPKQMSISITKPSSTSAIEKVESGLTLAQRLLSRIDLSQDAPVPTKSAPAPTKTVAVPKKKIQKSAVSDDEEDEVTPVKPQKAKSSRAAAVAASQKVFNLTEDDDELSEEDEESDGFGDEDDESEFSDDSAPKKKKQAAPVSKASTTAATTKKNSKVVTAPVLTKQAGKKRQTKTAAPAVTEAFSPGITTPRDAKKPRKTQKNAAVDRMESLISEPVAKVTKKSTKATAVTSSAPSKTKALAQKTQKKTARKIMESDDEEEEEDEVVFVPPKKSPKPVRAARKVVKSYALDSEDEDEEEEDELESEEDESEFDE